MTFVIPADAHVIDSLVYARRWRMLAVVARSLVIIGLDNTILTPRCRPCNRTSAPRPPSRVPQPLRRVAAVEAFVAEHLAELVAALEADGEAAAQRIDAAAAETLAGYAEWAQVEQRVPRLLPWLDERAGRGVFCRRPSSLTTVLRVTLDVGAVGTITLG